MGSVLGGDPAAKDAAAGRQPRRSLVVLLMVSLGFGVLPLCVVMAGGGLFYEVPASVARIIGLVVLVTAVVWLVANVLRRRRVR